MVELHYSILIIGWYFSVENVGIPRVDVYCVPVMVVAYVFVVVVVCSPIYEETLYRLLWPGRMLGCSNSLATGWCYFSAENEMGSTIENAYNNRYHN